MLAHGGTAGLVLELSVLLVPLVLILILVAWGRRHSGDRQPTGPDDGAGRDADGL